MRIEIPSQIPVNALTEVIDRAGETVSKATQYAFIAGFFLMKL
jgi:hypothetical protein